MDPIASCRLLLMHEAVFANFPLAMASSNSINFWDHQMNMGAFHTESQASLWHGSFLPGPFLAVVLITIGLEVGLLYAAACIEKKVLRYLVRKLRLVTEEFDKSFAHETRWVIYGALLAAILLYQVRLLTRSMGVVYLNTEWEQRSELKERALSKEGRKKQRLAESRAAKEQGWRHQMEKIRGLLHAGAPFRGRHMARILAHTRPILAPSSCFVVTLLLQMMRSACSLHQDVLRNQKRFTYMVGIALLCALQNLSIAIGIPPKATPAGVSRDSDESISMGNYTGTEPENISGSNSSVAKHDPVKGVAKTATTWLVASAAAHHATGNRDLLSGFRTLDDTYIQAVDGVTMRVCGRGSVITERVVLPDVWFVPGLNDNIVSASQLVELDHSVGFSRGVCYIRCATDDSVIGKARVGEDGMFQLEFLEVPLVN